MQNRQRDKPAEPAPRPKSASMGLPQLSYGDLGGATAAGWGTLSRPTPTPEEQDHRAGSAQRDHPRDIPPAPCHHPQAAASTPWGSALPLRAPPGTSQRQSGTISLPVGGFHRTSSPSRAGKGLMGHVIPGTGIQQQLPAPAAPPGRKRRAGAGEEGRAWREQHEKANPLPIVPSCAMLEMSPRVPLLFPQP